MTPIIIILTFIATTILITCLIAIFSKRFKANCKNWNDRHTISIITKEKVDHKESLLLYDSKTDRYKFRDYPYYFNKNCK